MTAKRPWKSASLRLLGRVALGAAVVLGAGTVARAGIGVADESLWPGEIKILRAQGGNPTALQTVYRRPSDPQPNDAVPRISSFTQGPTGIYFCSGLDGLILHMLDGGEKLVYRHDGQIRHVAYSTGRRRLFFSAVPTPQNSAPLTDGAIYQLNLDSGRVDARIDIAQRDVGHDWWGQFALHEKDIYVATFSTVYRLDRGVRPVEVYRAKERIGAIIFAMGTLIYGSEDGMLHRVEPDYSGETSLRRLAVRDLSDLASLRGPGGSGRPAVARGDRPTIPGRTPPGAPLPKNPPASTSAISISGRVHAPGTSYFGTVELSDDKGRRLRTLKVDSQGRYQFPGLKPGKYYVKLQRTPDEFYRTVDPVSRTVNATIGSARNVDFTLR